MKRAFTFVEMMVVVVIVGFLAAIILPKFVQFLEIQRVKIVKRQMEVIKNAVNFKLDGEKGEFCGAGHSPKCNSTAQINAQLNLNINDELFDFSITNGHPGIIKAMRLYGPVFYTLSLETTYGARIMCEPLDACAYVGMK